MGTSNNNSDVERLAERTGLDATAYFDAQLSAAAELALRHWPLLRAIAQRTPGLTDHSDAESGTGSAPR